MSDLPANTSPASASEASSPGHPPAESTASGPAWGRTRTVAVFALLVVALGGALAVGSLPKLRQQRDVNAAAAKSASASPKVTVATARRTAANAERVLPGNSMPLLEASMYARATGFVKSRLVDIGDRVQAGQILAVIDAPDVDDQLLQAQANVEQAKANLAKARADEEYAAKEESRNQKLVVTRTLSPESFQVSVQALGVAKAVVTANQAAIQVNEAVVKRYTDMQGFEKIIAPFPGVITARHIDPGDLVTADSTSRQLFHIMRTDVLRVFVSVPQVFAQGIKVGQTAAVYSRSEPQQEYAGKVTRTADALDPNTRTLLTEVQVPNPDNVLRAGMYLQVKFTFERSATSLTIPTAALATRADGPRVGVLDEQKRVHYRLVKLGRDYGAEVEVISGLKAGDVVVVHPGDDLPDGTVVEPVAPPTPKK